MSRSRLRVALDCATTVEDVPSRSTLTQWIRTALPAELTGEIAVRIVDEAESAMLNQRYRGRAGPTNVLAFESDPEAAALDPIPPLGDLVICAAVVAREAHEQGKATAAHWAHIVIHGALHLVGYDHDSDDTASIMEQKEHEVLARLGFEAR